MELELRPLNVLIGANGAGKSNLVSFFKLLNEMMGARLQQHIGTTGRAQSILHYGPKITPQMEASLKFVGDDAVDTYTMRLFYAAGDTLVFADECLEYLKTGFQRPETVSLGSGQEETRIGEAAKEGNQTARVFKGLLDRCRVYHFHDTSPTARVRQYGYVGHNGWLMPDAGNLAAFLLRLRDEDNGAAYNNTTTRMMKKARTLGLVPETFKFRELRGSFATIAACEARIADVDIERYVGHAGSSVLRRHYIRIERTLKGLVIMPIDTVFGNKLGTAQVTNIKAACIYRVASA